jgi:hypothetical protein
MQIFGINPPGSAPSLPIVAMLTAQLRPRSIAWINSLLGTMAAHPPAGIMPVLRLVMILAAYGCSELGNQTDYRENENADDRNQFNTWRVLYGSS